MINIIRILLSWPLNILDGICGSRVLEIRRDMFRQRGDAIHER
ncbi:MAG: hypothetical protein ACXV79_08685 [Methylobacter sp.]